MKKARFFIYICALVITMTIGNVGVLATDTNDLTVTNHSVGKSYIYPNDEFNLNFTLKNNNKSTDATDVSYTISANNFKVKNGSSVVNIPDINKDSEKPQAPISLIYTGGADKTITITVKYNSGDQTVNTIYISEAQNESNDNNSGGSINTSKYKPEFTLLNNKIPTGETGTTFNLDLKIKNDSNQKAKNVSIELVTPEDLKIDLINTINMVQNFKEIKAKETTNVKYSFSVRSNTEAKTYACSLKYTYYNSFNDKTETSQKFYIKINKGYPFISLNVSDVKTMPSSIKAGENIQLDFFVNNHAGLTKVDNVEVSLEGLSQDGFSLLDGVNSKTVNNILPLSEGGKVSFDLYASSKMEKGSYPLTVVMDYTDEANVKKSVKKTIYLLVDTGITSSVSIDNIKSPKGQIQSEQEFNVSFDVVNTGNNMAKDLIVTVKSGENVIPLSQNIHIINELKVGAKKTLNFKFQPTAEAITKSHLLNIEIKGKDENALTTINQYVGVYVKQKEKESENESKPHIIISRYDIDSHDDTPTIVNAGENFDLEIFFKNTHKNKKVENIKISLNAEKNSSKSDNSSAPANAFTPVNSSNTFLIEEILPGEFVSKKLVFYTIPYAESKPQKINVSLEYEDAKGKGYTAADEITVTVVQPSKFITSDIKVPEMMFVGEPVDIELDVSNTGNTTLSNFTVLVEGFGSSNSKSFIGNIDPGSTKFYSSEIWANEEGEVTGAFVFTYTKPDGKKAEIRKEFKTLAQAMEINQGGEGMNQGGEFPLMPEEEKKSSNSKKLIIIISCVAVVAIVIIFIVVRKIKKKKDLSFDE